MSVVALHHVESGSAHAEPVILGGSLGSTHELWDELAAELAADYRVISVDLRGHGDSPGAVPPVGVDDLAGDVIALADRLGLDTFHYVGISLGGAIGQQLALDAPTRLRTLTLACTAPQFGESQTWHERAAAVRAEGMEPLREPTGERWFVESVRKTPLAQRALDVLVAQDPGSYAACCEAVADFDVRDRLGEIVTPTLIIGADQDQVATPEVVRILATIPGSRTVHLTNCAHLANLGKPAEFNAAVRQQLAR